MNLVEQFNTLASLASAASIVDVKPVTRFASKAAGQKRLDALCAKVAKTGLDQDLIAAYNRLAAEPVAMFGSYEIGQAKLAALTEPVLDPPYPLSWHNAHARNEARKTRDKLAIMNSVLAALRAAAERDGTVDVRKVRLTVFPSMPAAIFSGHLRGLAMRGLYRKGKVALKGEGKYRAPVADD